jgi:hypothetical protein
MITDYSSNHINERQGGDLPMNRFLKNSVLVRCVHNAVCLFILLIIVTLMTGCSALTYKDLMPQQPVNSSRSNPQYNGTANVHSIITPEFIEGGQALPSGRLTLLLKRYVDNDLLEKALQESVANSTLFTRVEQKNADYVLDVWVEEAKNYTPTMGIGHFTADFSSIWRLTRVNDGKVLVCDFVNGHGVITSGMRPMQRSLFAGLQDMIQNGLLVLSDTSKEHFAARSVAGIRPSMGPAVPEGLTQWTNNVKKNWSKLRMGLTFEEVESFIGPVKASGALVRFYRKDYTQEYDTGLYTIVFLNGKLSRWELR